MEFKKILTLVGPPGCGKGTQGKKLVELGGSVLGVSSEIIRAHKAGLGLETQVQGDAKEKAALDGDDLATAANLVFIEKATRDKHIILDGFPRTAVQCKRLDGFLMGKPYRLIYVLFEADDDVCSERREKRIMEARAMGLTPRPDDDPVTHAERLRVYYANLSGIMEHIRTQGSYCVNIEAWRSTTEVYYSILNKTNWRP